MAESLRAKVEEQLSCAICLEHFKDPKVLSCQHTYCLECIARLDMTGNFLICPVCRAITEVGGGNEVMFKSLDIKVIKLSAWVSIYSIANAECPKASKGYCFNSKT